MEGGNELTTSSAHHHVGGVVHEHTTSVNRSFSDLDGTVFVLSAAVLCGIRTAAQQPLNLALTRKQTCSVAASMSTTSILQRIIRTEGGVRAVGQGMMPLVIGCAVSEAIYLGLFEYLREWLPMDNDFTRDAAAGYMSDVCSRLIHLPLSIIAYRQMTEQQFSHMSECGHPIRRERSALVGKRTSAWGTLRGMYGEGGMKSVFSGLGMTLAIGSQWSALWWAMYSQVKATSYSAVDSWLLPEAELPPSLFSWKHYLLSKDDNVMINSLSSVVTSASTAIVFNPFLVLRVNLQLSVKGTLIGTAKGLYQKGGWRAFYQGTYLSVGACIIDGFLASTCYEYAKLFADRSHHSLTPAH